ncbi:MAG: flagellar biosynthetic protein FliQ [Isosphaeraceae bacterium]
MDTTLVVDWTREAIRLSLLMGGPLLAVALVVGLVVGVGQTLTQLHEPVVAQVPRLIAVTVALLLLLPWLAGQWVGFTGPLVESIPRLVTGG